MWREKTRLLLAGNVFVCLPVVLEKDREASALWIQSARFSLTLALVVSSRR